DPFEPDRPAACRITLHQYTQHFIGHDILLGKSSRQIQLFPVPDDTKLTRRNTAQDKTALGKLSQNVSENGIDDFGVVDIDVELPSALTRVEIDLISRHTALLFPLLMTGIRHYPFRAARRHRARRRQQNGQSFRKSGRNPSALAALKIVEIP